MQLNRTSLLTEYRLATRFNEVRDRLLASATESQLAKPLAFWVLPTDRRLPLAFVGRSLKELLASSFETLLSTPGVGQKKMVALVNLLERAEANLENAATLPINAARNDVAPAAGSLDPAQLTPARVPEATWSLWCESIKRCHLEEETLGRFAPSLTKLSRVLWNTPLDAYCNLTLKEIRQLKTHGEKRVTSVLEVFHELYNVLSGLGSIGTLAVRVQPRIPGQIENWLLAALERTELPTPEELNRHVVVPLVDQVRLDLGDTIAQLLEDRLGIQGCESSVRQSALNLGLTRARVYQLLADAAEVIAVRWPEGQYLINHLADRIRQASDRAAESYETFLSTADVLFSARRAEQKAPDTDVDLAHQRRAG